ncbi:MAG: hypothetical protein KBT11_08030 [Treponema sp.]|nr:hypothetical protein [Candidatus Treponema equifaecale]
MEATRELKLEFLKCTKDFDDREIISNIDDENKKWFYIQAGRNEVADCFHLEFTEEETFEFHIETKEIISKFDCKKAFNDFKNLPEFSEFDFENGGWNFCTKGYIAPFKGEITENNLFTVILDTLEKVDDAVTKYNF